MDPNECRTLITATWNLFSIRETADDLSVERFPSLRLFLPSNTIARYSYSHDVVCVRRSRHLTSVSDPNSNVTTYAYDNFGRMARRTSPVTGTTTCG